MKIYRGDDIEKLCLKGTAVALGEFDSIHIGHREIIRRTVSAARESGFLSLVLMFENSPQDFISNKRIMPVNTLEKRLEIIDNLGVDIAVILKFDESVMNMTHTEFFEEFIVKKLDAGFLSVGFNYRFGRYGKGDAEYLKKACLDNKIRLCITDDVRLLGDTVSSTRIRELIADGNMEDTSKLLGRCFSVEGVVVKGNQLGGKLFGFPTANIEMPDSCAVPKYGVYISKVKLRNNVYEAISNVGAKPTVDKNGVGIETHILNEKFGPLYGERIEICFCKFIRGIVAFDNPEELTKQLEDDRQNAIEYFKGV